MPFYVNLENERHEVIEKIYEHGWLLKILDLTDRNYYCGRFIDRYGMTIFNRLQMDDFIKEMNTLKVESRDEKAKTFIDEIINLAEKCRNDVHTYIRFNGD